jgi:hypothetical protein
LSFSSWSHRYDELWELLIPSAEIWQRSILKTYQPGTTWVAPEWVEGLSDSSTSEWLWRFDRDEITDGTEGPLRTFLNAWHKLPSLARSTDETQLQRIEQLNEKKQHELRRILGFLLPHLHAHPVPEAVDLGGGVGHLARHLLSYSDLSITSLDQNTKLQAAGQDIYAKGWPQRINERLRFLSVHFGSQPDASVDRLLHACSLSLGLHTCGPLALHHLQRSLVCQHILNVGCCYDKLDPIQDTKRSQHAQQRGGPSWTTAALFLATRGRHRKSWQEFQLQQRVNNYRSALHLWLIESGRESGFVTLGNAPKQLYVASFPQYAQQVLGQELPAPELQAYWQSPRVQKEVHTIWLLHLVRERFSRPLELALLIDRALWMEEEGRHTSLVELFDRELSPRNIAIYSQA